MRHRIIVASFAAAALASGCATSDPRVGSSENLTRPAYSNENHYAVIDSIESGPADAYLIRVQFDDRSSRSVAQTSLGGLRVGDSVRIEDNRVRRY